MKRDQRAMGDSDELNFSGGIATCIVNLLFAPLCALSGNWILALMFVLNGALGFLNAMYRRSDARWVYWAKAGILGAAVALVIIAIVQFLNERAV